MELSGPVPSKSGEASRDFHAHAAELVAHSQADAGSGGNVLAYFREVLSPYYKAWDSLQRELESRDAIGVAQAVREVARCAQPANDVGRLEGLSGGDVARDCPTTKALSLAILKALEGEFTETDAGALLALLADGSVGGAIESLRLHGRTERPKAGLSLLAESGLASVVVSRKTPRLAELAEHAAKLMATTDQTAALVRNSQVFAAGSNPALRQIAEAGRIADSLRLTSVAEDVITRGVAQAEQERRLFETYRPLMAAERVYAPGIVAAAEEARRVDSLAKQSPLENVRLASDFLRDATLSRDWSVRTDAVVPSFRRQLAEEERDYAEAVRQRVAERREDDREVAELRRQLAELKGVVKELTGHLGATDPRPVAAPIPAVAPVVEDASTCPADSLDALTPAVRLAWASWKLAESNLTPQAKDRDAYDWLREASEEYFAGDLVGYVLPAVSTWCRYLREARKAIGESKHSRRAGRPHGGSVVAASEVD